MSYGPDQNRSDAKKHNKPSQHNSTKSRKKKREKKKTWEDAQHTSPLLYLGVLVHLFYRYYTIRLEQRENKHRRDSVIQGGCVGTTLVLTGFDLTQQSAGKRQKAEGLSSCPGPAAGP
jgi:hypothetical protein